MRAVAQEVYRQHDSESHGLLQVRGLESAFDTERGLLKAVDGVSFSVARGQTLGIVGESGCGKSVTAMSLISLLPRPAGKVLAGEVLFKGEDLLRYPRTACMRSEAGRLGQSFRNP
mgnify:CR=1 FL=1